MSSNQGVVENVVPDVLDSPEAGALFIRGGALRAVSYGINLLASLAAVPLMIRHLGPADYGRFATASAVVFIISGVTEAGLNTLGTREYANRAHADREWLLRNLVGLRLTATAVGIVVAMSIVAVAGSPRVVVLGVLVAGGGLMVTLAGESYGIPLATSLRLGWVSILGVAQQVTLACAYIGLVLLGARVVPMLGATALSGGVLLLSTAVLVRREVSIRPAWDTAVWLGLLRETLPYAAAAAVGMVYFREALVLMSYLSSGRQTGYYAAAFRIVEVLTVVPWLLVSSGFPILARAARDDLARLRYALQRLFEVGLILGVWLTLSTVVGARVGIDVVAGHNFMPSVPVLRIQSLAIITSFMVAIFGFMLLSLRMYGALLRANAIAVVVATTVSIVLIPMYGAKGAAVAPIASEGCLALAYAASLARSPERLRVSARTLPRVALAGGVAVGLAYLTPAPDLVRLVVMATVYLLALLLMRAVPFEVVSAIRRRPDHGA